MATPGAGAEREPPGRRRLHHGCRSRRLRLHAPAPLVVEALRILAPQAFDAPPRASARSRRERLLLCFHGRRARQHPGGAAKPSGILAALLRARRVETRHAILFELRAPATGLANGAAAATSDLTLPTPAVAAATRRRPRVVLRWPRGPPQVPPARLPARHGRRTTRRQAHGLRALRSRRRRRRRERRQRSPRGSCDGVCACWSVSEKR